MAVQGNVGLSEYELRRLERIKENQKMLEKLFPEGTSLHVLLPDPRNGESTPETGRNRRRNGCASEGKVVMSRRKLLLSPRRNPSRKARPVYPDLARRPVTRSLSRSSSGSEELVNGLKDEEEVRRVVFSTRKRKFSEIQSEPLPIELDSRPGSDPRVFKTLVKRSTDKIYDRVRGTTCHQCRQKTIDVKTDCHNKNCNGVRGQFCGPCLKNRYGEEIREVLVDTKWVCPPCRGICNCSFCLPKKGRPPTGIMIHTAREAGCDSVMEFLEKSNYDY